MFTRRVQLGPMTSAFIVIILIAMACEFMSLTAEIRKGPEEQNP
jgi:hypothetical protein